MGILHDCPGQGNVYLHKVVKQLYVKLLTFLCKFCHFTTKLHQFDISLIQTWRHHYRRKELKAKFYHVYCKSRYFSIKLIKLYIYA